MTCGCAVSARTVGGAGGGVSLPVSHGEKLGFILNADSKILLETKNGILFFPRCLSFGFSCLEIYLRGSQNWKEELVPTKSLLPTVYPFPGRCGGGRYCHKQQTFARNTWEVTLLHPSPRGLVTKSMERKPSLFAPGWEDCGVI